VAAFNLLYLLVIQVGQGLRFGDAQGFALCFTPSLQAGINRLFVALAGRCIKVGTQQIFWQVLLGKVVVGVVVGVLVVFAMA